VSAGELALVIGSELCALAFAALAVTLVRVRDTVGALRGEVVVSRTESVAAVDGPLGSAEAIGSIAGRGNRVSRTALSAPMIKAAGIATGTSRAVRRLRSEQ
jgi:hypothetical protein